MPKRTLLMRDTPDVAINTPECTCDTPRLPAHIKYGVCGNCGGARGPDCPNNKPIVTPQTPLSK